MFLSQGLELTGEDVRQLCASAAPGFETPAFAHAVILSTEGTCVRAVVQATGATQEYTLLSFAADDAGNLLSAEAAKGYDGANGLVATKLAIHAAPIARADATEPRSVTLTYEFFNPERGAAACASASAVITAIPSGPTDDFDDSCANVRFRKAYEPVVIADGEDFVIATAAYASTTTDIILSDGLCENWTVGPDQPLSLHVAISPSTFVDGPSGCATLTYTFSYELQGADQETCLNATVFPISGDTTKLGFYCDANERNVTPGFAIVGLIETAGEGSAEVLVSASPPGCTAAIQKTLEPAEPLP